MTGVSPSVSKLIMVPQQRVHWPGQSTEFVGALVMLLRDHMRTGASPSLQTRNSLAEGKVFLLPGVSMVDFMVEALASLMVMGKVEQAIGATTSAAASNTVGILAMCPSLVFWLNGAAE
jgi:hypothetical protein